MGAEKEKEWFYMSLGHRRGPVTEDEVCRMIAKQEVYIDSTQVWKNGMTQWVSLADAKDFAPAIKKIKREVAAMDARVRESAATKGIDEDVVCRGIARGVFNFYFYIGWLAPLLVGVIFLTELQVFQLVEPISLKKHWWLMHFPVLLMLLATCKMCGFRMQHAGYSKAAGWGLLIPVYNLWTLFVCLFAPRNFKRRKKIGPSILVYVFLLLGVAAAMSPAVLPKLTLSNANPLAVNEDLQRFYKNTTNFESRYDKRASTHDKKGEERKKRKEQEDQKQKGDRPRAFSDRQGDVTRKRGLRVD